MFDRDQQFNVIKIDEYEINAFYIYFIASYYNFSNGGLCFLMQC